MIEIFSYFRADELKIIRDRIKEELLFAYFYSYPVYLYPTFFHTDKLARVVDLPKPKRAPKASEDQSMKQVLVQQ